MFAPGPRAVGFTIVWPEGVIFRSMMTYHVQFLLLVLAGWVNRQQQDVIDLSIIIISPGLDSRARTALEPMLESVVSARGKVLRTNFSATSRVTRATKLTQAASRHSYRWCSPPTRGSATTFAVGDGRCVTALKLGVSLFSPKWQRSS